MYFWNSYPFIRYAAAFILGILSFEALPHLWIAPKLTTAILILVSILCVTIAHRFSFYKLRVWNGTLALVSIAFLGGYQTKTTYHSHDALHYKNLDQKVTGFSGTIVSPPTTKTRHLRYDLRIHSIVGDTAKSANGVLHLYVRKNPPLEEHLTYGAKIHVKGAFYPISKPSNPKTFNYKKYLARQDIYAHAFVTAKDIKVVEQTTPNRLVALAGHIRNKATETIDLYVPETRENAIVKALLLGVKDFLDNELRHMYASAGAMHVLAVSGLHVGIIYLLLQMVFGKLADQGTWGKMFFGILSISFIWIYAMITGLSPSVLRAATMFSLLALSQMVSKESNIYNTMGFACFTLLLFDPYLIYAVGFQLSFAAVFGILYFQPKLYNLLAFRTWLLDKAWAITCVSVSAQIATFPLGLFYFHQFPTYFLLANLIVIPGAFLLIIVGFCMVISEIILPPFSALLGRVLYLLTWMMNECISYIDSIPYSLIDWIHLDKPSLILTYVIMLTLVCGIHFRSFTTLALSSFLGICLAAHAIDAHHSQKAVHKLIFYAINDHLAIDHVNGYSAILYLDRLDSSTTTQLSFQVDPYRRSSHLARTEDSLSEVEDSFLKKGPFYFGMIGGKKILIIDSLTFSFKFTKIIETDILIVNNEAVKNLEWLKQNFKYEHLIISSKNDRYYHRSIKEQARKAGIDAHSLVEDGALVLHLEHKKRADSLPALFTTNPD